MNITRASLVGILTAAVSYGGWMLFNDHLLFQKQVQETRQERLRFSAELRLRSALAGADISNSGWVQDAQPSWFRRLPRNLLLPETHAWVEIASTDDARRRHPKFKKVENERDAAWWYNPATGDLRARIPANERNSSSFDLYALVNQ